jgi:sialic acid synthase SpsE
VGDQHGTGLEQKETSMILRASDLPKPFVVADCGSNWCRGNTKEQQLTLAKRHIFDAALCGVNAVKFQMFTDKELYGFDGPNQYSLPREWIPELAAYAAENSVEFMCSAFSVDGYKYIDGFVNIHKVASAEMKHPEMLSYLASTGKPLIISTGGAHFDELDWLMQYLWEQHADMSQIVLMDCAPNYPAECSEYNLLSLKRQYSVRKSVTNTEGLASTREWMGRPLTGVSDHTMTENGSEVALVGIGVGATFFELHFDALKHNIPGMADATPDTDTSSDVYSLREYVDALQKGYAALGNVSKRGGRQFSFTERFRRRLKVIAPIKAGEKLQYGVNYGIFRSLTTDLTAAAPELYQRFDGLTAKKDLRAGDPVWWDFVEVPVSE